MIALRRATKLARPALAKSLRGWAVLPNPFATARGSAARARWLTRTGKKTSATAAITPYSYEASSHRLTNTGTEARTYDAVGNPRTIGPRTLTYDDRSRLTVFVNGSTTRRYQYTGQGLRVRKWTSSNTSGNSYFVYNENAQLVGEYDNAGSRVQEIIWLGNLPIGVIAGTSAAPVLHYIESDHLGTPRIIVDATRNVGIWRWNQTNDPFGESTPNQNPDGDATSVTFNLRFAGQYRDSESGYHYNVHRYYDPTIGRYLESDPIGLGGGISTYSYVGAAPLTATDPLGLSAADVATIQQRFDAAVRQMTEQGLRHPSPFVNNQQRFWGRLTGNRVGDAKKLDCGEQTDYVNDHLRQGNYDDDWTFLLNAGTGHARGIAISSNPSDPRIWYDSRSNSFSVGAPCATCSGWFGDRAW